MTRTSFAMALPAIWAALGIGESTALAQVAEPPLPPNAAHGAPAGTAPAGSGSPKSDATGAGSECFPACREGFVCHQRQCISACNPPCSSGQTCVAGRRCESAPAESSSVREPPLPPPSKGFADRSYVMIGFHYGFSGNVNFPPGEVDLAPTYGVNLRGDVPIEKYLLLGPLFQFGAWRPGTPSDSSYSYYFDVDLYVRGRLPITTSSTNFQIWAGVPVGLTFNMLGSDVAPNVSGAALGWNIGVLGGAAVHFSPKVGIFTEIGWLQHKFTHSGDPQSLYVKVSQMNFNVGFVFPQ